MIPPRRLARALFIRYAAPSRENFQVKPAFATRSLSRARARELCATVKLAVVAWSMWRLKCRRAAPRSRCTCTRRVYVCEISSCACARWPQKKALADRYNRKWEREIRTSAAIARRRRMAWQRDMTIMGEFKKNYCRCLLSDAWKDWCIRTEVTNVLIYSFFILFYFILFFFFSRDANKSVLFLLFYALIYF